MKQAIFPMPNVLVIAMLMLLVTDIIHSSEAMIPLTPQQELGKKLFFDPRLSEPVGQSCATCHDPAVAFTDKNRQLPVSRGVHPDRFGSRNAPTLTYIGYSPALHLDPDEKIFVGGLFWDGRANNFEEQAEGPLLNPVEMANSSKQTVVAKVKDAGYTNEFNRVFGANALQDTDAGFQQILRAIDAYQRSQEFNPFTSKYDYYLAGKAQLSEQEMRGLKLYEAENKGNCAACHPSQPGPNNTPPLFTDFTYDNLGVPKNPNNPFYSQNKKFNPEGENFIDYGLALTTKKNEDNGKFKVPTVRNIELTAPYMHNGVFATLQEVVDFYNTRDVKSWPAPEVKENVNKDELGDLKLTEQEVKDIVVFMKTLSDGYVP